MMLSVRRKPPVDYSKCDQTVTVYHRGDDRSITRTLFEKRAFLDFRKNQTINKTGSIQSNSFLMVIPCETCTVAVGDKVLLDNGPETVCWEKFIPALIPGLVIVKYVDPKYWKGKMCHVEAGG